jgi:CRISPR/Cas system CSM-associated protein Csm3 (group 7 of RAMP superfamily)
MPTHEITFTFISPWHMGSGYGEGSNLDAVPVKSPAGLPLIPGKSIKGLFREALLSAEEFGKLDTGTTLRLVGSRDDTLSRYDSTPGCLYFDCATLGKNMEAWASDSKNAAAVRQLFMTLASTRIDQNGLASDKTLRRIEIAVPLTLTAKVNSTVPISKLTETLQLAASLIREAGTHRHRGLGRVIVSVKEVQQ